MASGPIPSPNGQAPLRNAYNAFLGQTRKTRSTNRGVNLNSSLADSSSQFSGHPPKPR